MLQVLPIGKALAVATDAPHVLGIRDKGLAGGHNLGFQPHLSRSSLSL